MPINLKQKKNAWSEKDTKLLFDLAKAKSTLKEAYKAFPNRTEVGVRDKLNRMGFRYANGVIK